MASSPLKDEIVENGRKPSSDAIKKENYDKFIKKLFCAQLVMITTVSILVSTLHYLYEELIFCRYESQNCTGLWFGAPANVSLMIDLVLYSILVLNVIVIVITFLIYDHR